MVNRILILHGLPWEIATLCCINLDVTLLFVSQPPFGCKLYGVPAAWKAARFPLYAFQMDTCRFKNVVDNSERDALYGNYNNFEYATFTVPIILALRVLIPPAHASISVLCILKFVMY